MASKSTELIHHAYRAPEGFDAVVPAVHKASTVLFKDAEAVLRTQWKDKSGYTYGLHGTPTTFTLEERLATLEGGLQCLLAPSGLSALALVNQALLQAGDEVLLPDNAYGPNRDFVRVELSRWGIRHAVYDPMSPADLAARITPATRLVWLEAAGSVTLEFPDLLGLLGVCRAHERVVTALDNTWGAGLAFNPFALGLPDRQGSAGVDLSVHALTKYPSGGADVLMGSVVSRDDRLHQALKMTHMRLGLGVSGNDAEFVLKGLPTVALRYAAHDRATREVARWLQQQPGISRVLHPALPDSPGHAHWAATCQGAAGLVSVVLDAEAWPQARVHRFVDALKLFGIGYSWGGPMSLVMAYPLQGMRQFGSLVGHGGTLVRFNIGLESPPDLMADIAQALAQA